MDLCLTLKEVKVWARRVFKDVDPLPSGFALDCITVIFKNKVMVIRDYDENPPNKLNEGTFLWPKTAHEILKNLVYHCGEEKISKRLKNNITIINKQ